MTIFQMKTPGNVLMSIRLLILHRSLRHGIHRGHSRSVGTVDQQPSPISKNQMSSGIWTIVILDNNGNSSSIAFQRTVTLTVGPQQTVTYTPTGATEIYTRNLKSH